MRRALVAEVGTQLARFNTTGLVRPGIDAGTIGPDEHALGAASLPRSERYLGEP